MADKVELKSPETPPDTGADKLPEAVVQPTRGGTAQVTVNTEQKQKADEPKPERPAWLPEEFETPEQLAEAWKKSKEAAHEKPAEEPKHEQQPPADKKAAEEQLQKSGLDLGEFTAEYAKNGKLSEESLAKLEKVGISRQMVDAYIEGQKARANEYRAALANAVGGEEALQATLKWAETALSQDEIAAANRVLQSMDSLQATLVLQGLNARRLAEVGEEPKLASGRASPSRGDVVGYESTAQWIADVNSKAYKSDPAFREYVARRLALSNF